MVRPYKRRSVSEHDSPAGIFQRRARLDLRLKSRFESIFEKYGKDFSGIGDEIDLESGEIVVNHGHVDGLRDETDPGRPEDLFDELNPDEESCTPIIRLTRTSSQYTRQIVSTMRITSQLDTESASDIDDLGLDFSGMKRRVVARPGRISLPTQVGPPHLAKSDPKLFYKSRQSYPPIAIAQGPLDREAAELQWRVPQLPKSSPVIRESNPASPCPPLQHEYDRSPSPPCYSIWSCKEASVYRNGDSVLSQQSISISAKSKTSIVVKDKHIDDISGLTVKDRAPHVTRTEFPPKGYPQETSDKPQVQQQNQKSTFRFARIPIKIFKPPIQPEKTAKLRARNISVKITRSQTHRKDTLTFETEGTSLSSVASAVQQEYTAGGSRRSRQWKGTINGRILKSQTDPKEEISNGLLENTAGKSDDAQGKFVNDNPKTQLRTLSIQRVTRARAQHGEAIRPVEENGPGHIHGVGGTLSKNISEPRLENGSVHLKRRYQQKESLKAPIDNFSPQRLRHPSELSKATYTLQKENRPANVGRVAQNNEALQSELNTSPVYAARRRGRSSKAISVSREENTPVLISSSTQQKETPELHVAPRRGRSSKVISESQEETTPVQVSEVTQAKNTLKSVVPSPVQFPPQPPVQLSDVTQQKEALKSEGTSPVNAPPKRRGTYLRSISKSQVVNVPIHRSGSIQREGGLKIEAEIAPVTLIRRRGRPKKAIAKSEVGNRPVQPLEAPALRDDIAKSLAEKFAIKSVQSSFDQKNDSKPQSQNICVKSQDRSPEDISKSQAANSLTRATPTPEDLPGSILHAPTKFGETSITREADIGSKQIKGTKNALKCEAPRKDCLRSQSITPMKVLRSDVKPRINPLSLCCKRKWAIDDLSEDELSTPLKRVRHIEVIASIP